MERLEGHRRGFRRRLGGNLCQFWNDPVAAEEARLRLAEALRSIADEDSRDVGDCQIVCVRGFREGGFRFSSSCVETEASKAWSASLLGCSERSSPKAA